MAESRGTKAQNKLDAYVISNLVVVKTNLAGSLAESSFGFYESVLMMKKRY